MSKVVKILLGLILQISFLQVTLASEYQQLIKIPVLFTGDPLYVTYVRLGNDYQMTCLGENNGYKITGSVQDPNGIMDIGVMGPFDGDGRTICKLYDSTTSNTNRVYFAVESLPIFYTYKGVQHSCIIDQNIGTSYDSIAGGHNKLQGEKSNIYLPCNGLVSTDTYSVMHGSFANNATNFINLNIHESSNITIPIRFNVANSNLLASEYLGESYVMSCTGLTSFEYPNGYTVTGGYQSTSPLIFGIRVIGQFTNDHRDICKVKDQTTGNTNKLYFAVESLPIYFEYNGVKHSCHIDQQVGTSNDKNSGSTNKLQGEISSTVLPCNGLVDNDTYIVNPGHSFQNMGNITINVSGQ